MTKNLFFLALIVTASGLVSPPLALLSGLVYGFSFAHPFNAESKQVAKFLLQVSIVALGFGMNLQDVLQAGRSGFLYTAASIVLAMLLGLGLGSLIRVEKESALLISAGTAICGGSAIAAVGPIADANEEQMAVSLGTIFVLNSVALFLFPAIGLLFHLSQEQFGLWSALPFTIPALSLGRPPRTARQRSRSARRSSWRALFGSFLFLCSWRRC
jgi:uncharacterized membrane protein YadS